MAEWSGCDIRSLRMLFDNKKKRRQTEEGGSDVIYTRRLETVNLSAEGHYMIREYLSVERAFTTLFQVRL